MNSQAVELARRAFAALSAEHLGAIDNLFAQNVTVTTETTWPGGGTFSGRDAAHRFIGQFREGFGAVKFEETTEPEVVGKWALFRGRWVGSGRSSGIETITREFNVAVSARESLITEMRFFWDELEARAYIAE